MPSKTVATRTKFRLKGKSRDSYVELVLDFPLASIQSDEHLAEAQRVIDGLLSRGTLDAGEETYLDALSDLVGSYEDEHHSIEPASDADMLRHLMEARGGVSDAIEPGHGSAQVHDFRSARRKEAVQSQEVALNSTR